MKADGPESRHLLPAMRVLTDVLGGTLQRHPRDKRNATGDAKCWKAGDEWKRPES